MAKSKARPPKVTKAPTTKRGEAASPAPKAVAPGKLAKVSPAKGVKISTQPSAKGSGTQAAPGVAAPAQTPEEALASLGSITNQSGVDLTEKIKELVRLAQEQGYLTYGDINDALPENIVSPEDLEDIYTKLRNLEIEIVDQAEVDRVKQPEPEEEQEDKSRLDILDDPVRMYLKQIGRAHV